LYASSALAEFYRWTDEAGRVHYGERPPAEGAERIAIESPSTATDPPPDEAARRARRERLLESFEYERSRKAEAAAEAERREQRRRRDCDRAKQAWARLNYPGPIYLTDEEGTRRYLDEAGRVAEKARLRPAYRQACDAAPD
jgi:hypothetical protein